MKICVLAGCHWAFSLPGVCEAPDWYIGACPSKILSGEDVFSHQDQVRVTSVVFLKFVESAWSSIIFV